mgnify:CR=1 FL=1
MMWLNGVEPPPGMPPDTQIKVSRRFEGSGAVHLTRHLATRDKRRMQGTVKGEVKQKTATSRSGFLQNLILPNHAEPGMMGSSKANIIFWQSRGSVQAGFALDTSDSLSRASLESIY